MGEVCVFLGVFLTEFEDLSKLSLLAEFEDLWKSPTEFEDLSKSQSLLSYLSISLSIEFEKL